MGQLSGAPARADLQDYAARVRGGEADEAVGAEGLLASYVPVAAALAALPPAHLSAVLAERDRLARDRGMTFALPGEPDRLFPLDLVPRLVDAREWRLVRRGLEQRARGLQLLLRDLAGPREAVRAGVLPEALVPPAGQVRSAGAEPAPAVVAGMDLLRTGDGRWLVLEDNLRVPSGLGYSVLVREVASTAVPTLRPTVDVADPSSAIALLAAALRACAPAGAAGEPRTAVLSAGPTDSA